ncbi:MAG TPA: HD domain-containing phosphohydrolase [Rhodocyclaceae bacterium]
MAEQHPSVPVDQLRIGLFVELDLKWFEHPFAFNAFRIKSEDQIRTIRGLGLKKVRYDPSRSDAKPPERPPEQPSAAVLAARAELERALEAKRALVERIRVQREAAARVATAFVDTANTVRSIEKNLSGKPEETVRQAERLVDKIADSILSAPELAIHVMGDTQGNEELYFHSLNVAMLSLMMARGIGMPQEAVGSLGMGALFHDVGRRNLPSTILMKKEALTEAERHLYEMHCEYGVEIGRSLKFNPAMQAIIREHHECYDGSGYPAKLKGEDIHVLARIVAIANHYDELCNPPNLADALTPHEALSQMFARQRGKFDPKLLQAFIRCLGVYPPGTIVQLANGAVAMVATINTDQPMKPTVVVYDPEIPKEEAILVDMAFETDTNIVKAIRPGQVPREVYAYLSPRQQVSYYFDAERRKREGAGS